MKRAITALGLAHGLGLMVAGGAAHAAEQVAQARANSYQVANGCGYPVRVLVHLVDPERGWRTFGWYTLENGAKTKALKTRNRYVYHYAEAIEGKRPIGSARSDGTRRVRVGAEVYPMIRINLGRRFRSFTKTLCK